MLDGDFSNRPLAEVDIIFTPKLGKANLSGPTSSANEKRHKESKIEFNLQPSIYVKADDSTEWKRLKCFDSIDGSNNTTFFAGGPIQSSAFSIMPNGMKVNQYLALAVGNDFYNNHSYTNTKNVSGTIQFWNVGSLHERKTLIQSPSMELALYHDNGIITEMKWCPADCYVKRPSTCHLPRLGLLAASASDSNVYIYSVPQPDFMPKSKHSFPIYFTQPIIKLIPFFGEPSNATRETVATCMDWEKNGEQIVAGYGNGAVCVWMIKYSSFGSHAAVKNTEQSYIIQPYLFFQASVASISSLSFAPFNNRWLVVSSIDKILRYFDLHDTSAPFHAVKQGSENSCIWGDAFCGVYSSPHLNSMGLISLSSKDCCAESNDKGVLKGLFDSSTFVAVSKNKNFHAIADMAGTVTVNLLKNISKPLETSYLTYMLFDTEIMDLVTTNDEMIKCSECSKDLMHDLLIRKISNQPKSSSHILSFDTSNNSAYCGSKGAKLPSDRVLTTSSGASDYSGDTIIYPIEPIFWDTSHPNILKKSVTSNVQSKSLNEKGNKLNKTTVHEKNETLALKTDLLAESSFNFSSADVKSGNSCSSEDSFSKNCCEPMSENCNLNNQNRNLKKINYFNYDNNLFRSNDFHFTSTYSDFTREEYLGSKKFPKEVMENGDTHFQTMNSEGSLIPRKDAIKFSSQKSFGNPLCDVPESKNLNRSESLPEICSSATSVDLIICDKIDQQFSDGTLIESPAGSDFSGDTIIYVLDSDDCDDKTDANCLNMEKPGATFQSLCKSEKENTFQETLLLKIDEKEVVVKGSETKLLTENSSFFAIKERCKHFLAEVSLKCNSGYESDSETESCSSGEEDRNLFPENLTSGFQELDLEYFCEKSKERHTELNELPKSNQNPQELSYQDLIANYGVVYKNNFDKSAKPLTSQEDDIYIKYNPLSVIKTITCDPNEGCESWLFVGGNSGIGRIVSVPDFEANVKKRRPQPTRNKKELMKRILT